MALPAKKYPPRPFPRQQVESVLFDWWVQQEEDLRRLGDPFQELRSRTGTVFDVLPLISSQQAVEVVLVLEPIVGYEIPESVVKKGGYHSCDELVEHLVENLMALEATR